MGHRKIEASVKTEAVGLVVGSSYSVPQAARIMGVGPTALRRWVDAWHEREARMPTTMADQKVLIEQLQAQLKASEEACSTLAQERDLLKKSLPSHLAALFQRRTHSTR